MFISQVSHFCIILRTCFMTTGCITLTLNGYFLCGHPESEKGSCCPSLLALVVCFEQPLQWQSSSFLSVLLVIPPAYFPFLLFFLFSFPLLPFVKNRKKLFTSKKKVVYKACSATQCWSRFAWSRERSIGSTTHMCR